MDNSPVERLPGPVVGEEDQTVVPTSPQGSAASQRSSTSRSSARSSNSSSKSEARQKTIHCRKHCSTVLACLLVGVMITLGSVAMTVCGYFAISIASETVHSGNSTTVVLDEQLHENLNKFRTFGPVMIGFGSFLIMCACVLLCEEKDKRNKTRGQASENLLSEHERIMQQARERFYNENRNTLLVESPSVDCRTPKASSNELTSCLDSDIVENRILTQVKSLSPSAPENDNASGTSGSPVVLVHGPTIVEPAQCEVGDNTQCTNENEVSNNSSPSHSNHSSPEHKLGSPSRTIKKNNSSIDDGGSGLVLPISPVLPRIDSSRSNNGVSRAGGAIPKSILVQPIKLSPIRSVNGPIRVRLDDSPTELSPFSHSCTSKSAECLPQPRGSPGRVKRGKKKKPSGGLQPGGFGQCRCLSDPSMTSVRSTDRQTDACCCLQPNCCWGGNCKLDKSIPSSSASASKSTDDPLSALSATSGKGNCPLLQPLTNIGTNVKAQSIELKPKTSEELLAADRDNHGSNKQDTTIQETHLIQQNSERKEKPNDEKDVMKDTPPSKGEASPTRQVGSTNECSATGGQDVTADEISAEKLVVKDRNSNIKVSSKRQDTSGKSAPYSGQSKSGVMV